MRDVGDNFYSTLEEITSFTDVVSLSRHRDVPDDWTVVITDVKGSTQAIEAGRYRDVNALGVASILALRNALTDVELPFVFGGDGATIVVPTRHLDAIDAALRGVRAMARSAFDMELRVGRVSVAELKEAGAPVRLARYRQSEHVALAAFSGRGFVVAEEWIKDPDRGGEYAVSEEGPSDADFSGFECRWQPVPAEKGKIVSLLVVALGKTPGEREAIYGEVLQELEALGCLSALPPFQQNQMRLRGVFSDYSTEAKIRSRHSSGEEFEEVKKEARKLSLIGKALLLTGKEGGGFDGSSYKADFLKNTDHRKFDEALRMVLDLEASTQDALARVLEALHERKQIAYGTHESDEALLTCMVGGYDGDHVHFVDGADGGYALASKPLKAQLKALERLSRLPPTL